MRDNNFGLIVAKAMAAECVARETQTDITEVGIGDRGAYKFSNEKLEEIDGSLLNFFIENLLPFSFVENEPFKMFAKALEPKYHFPKRKKLVTKVGMLYNTVKDSLKSELAQTQAVVFTHNSWLSLENNMYDMVKVHYICENWKLRTAALKTSQVSENPRSIAEHLEETRMKWNLHEPVFVSDDSELETKIAEILEWKQVPCFGSCIQSVIKHCLSKAEVYRFLNQGRRLVSQVTNNAKALEMLGKKKTLLLPEAIQNKTLVLDDGEKWSSMLEMISVLSELTPALHAAIMDPEMIGHGVDLRSLLYPFSEQTVLESLVKILTPFKTATEILTKNSDPTLQKVIPIFVKLDKVLDLDDDDCSLIKDVKVSLRSRIMKYLHSSKDMCLLACLLHPQTKQMAFVAPKEKENVKSLLFADVRNQCEHEFEKNQKEASQFRKGKNVGLPRQTKSMSEVADNSDVRRIVVSSSDGNVKQDTDEGSNDDDNEEEEEKGEESSEGEVSTDADDSAGDNDTKQSKGSSRNVKKTQKADLTSLSITVENDWLDDVIGSKDDQKSPEETAKIEVNLYMAEPASNKPPLDWWKEKCELYPHISKIAKRVLAVPASAVTAEEVFLMKKGLEKKHMQVKSEHMDMMLFLKENKDFCESE